MRSGGFTLVEVAVVLAVAALLLTLTLPSSMGPLLKARRSDAVSALMRVQLAQEQFRAHHGIYSANRQALIGASFTRSESGWYDITLVQVQPDRYQASAVPRADSPQANDRECPRLTLVVSDGRAEFGPTLRCWNR